jgi:predicted DNA-binding transcriptional regulator AlpA
MPVSPVLLTESEAAEYLSVSRSFLAQGRMKGGDKYPRFKKLGRSIRYAVADLATWLEGSTCSNTLYPANKETNAQCKPN